MMQAKRVADQMHSLGMKVSLYMGGTMFIETLYRELPQAKEWEQRDQWDQWVPYGSQTYRHYACPNEPKYRDYLRTVIKVGVEELHVDEFAFDNIMLQAEPHSCHCPRCVAGFHAMLKKRYPTKEAALRRFGLPDTDWVTLHDWGSETEPDSVTALNDPVLQEWVRFRCESLAHYANDLYDAVKAMDPKVAVLFNIKGVYSFNRYWTNAVYQPLYAGKIDLMAFDTGGYDEHIDPQTGALISQIRSYKMARRLETGCEDAFANDLRAAVHMSFGYQKPVAGLAAAPMGSGAFNVFTPMMEFFREYNDRYYTGVDNVADVAVLRTWATMAYSVSASYVPTTLVEQVLIQYKVPWDLLFEEQMDRIGRYSAVILAGQECLSDAQAAALLDYVRGGGTLIVAGNTGTYNEWRETRKTNPLGPARTEGKGRVLVVGDVIRADKPARGGSGNEDPEPGFTSTRGVHMNPPQWVLPKNAEEIYRTVAAGVPAGLSLTSDAPLTTVMEIQRRAATQETIAHFINFETKQRVAPFAASVKKQFPATVKSVTLFTPGKDEPVKLEFTESAGAVKFTVPEMGVYSMVVVG
jgi:predicted peroxiredoxin